MRTSTLTKILQCLLLVIALATTAARAEPDWFGLGTGSDGPLVLERGDAVINKYTEVTAPLQRGHTSISVANTTGFVADDLVMVLQTTGIDPEPASGGSAELNITDKQVGKWELARLRGVSGGSLLLDFPLMRNYAANVTQIIRVPEYTDVTVHADASIKAEVWDGGTGGVVAFLATGTVTNHGLIDANGKGFRGGLSVKDSDTSGGCGKADYPAPKGGQKGEGIAFTRFGLFASGHGNVANGGGGGVCEQSGGGGGGNGGSGGRGGHSASTDGQREVGGMGGGSLKVELLSQLVLGGGGGMGHGRNSTVTEAGRGGGIIFIRARQLDSRGTISAMGSTGATTDQNGAGGGGAGGSIYLRMLEASSCSKLIASGGVGSNANASLIGPGGGGGGGRILLQQFGDGCDTLVVGANPGSQTESTAPGGAHYGALKGGNGEVVRLPGRFMGSILEAPIVTSPSSGTITTDVRISIRGSAEPNRVVIIYVDGLEVGRVTAGPSGGWSFETTVDYSEGSHQVNASTEYQGVQSPPSADVIFIIHRAEPETMIISGPPASSSSTSATFTFGSNERGVSYECSLDGGSFVACSYTVTFTGLGSGNHTLLVRARDAAEAVDPTPASHTWGVDQSAPDTYFEVLPRVLTGPSNATFDFGSNESPVTYECSVDGHSFWDCGDPTTLPYQVGGIHRLEVRAKDLAGNVDPTPAVHTWTVEDVPPPAPIILSPRQHEVVNTHWPVIQGTAEPGASVEVYISHGIIRVLVGIARVNERGDWILTSSVSYPDKSYLFVQVRAVDPAGNIGLYSDGKNFKVDLEATVATPDTSIVSGPSGTVTTTQVTFDFGSNVSGVTYECSMDGSAYQACPDPYTFTVTVGTHTLRVRARDSSGNVDPTPVEIVWTTVIVPTLDTFIAAGPSGELTSREATFEFASNGNAVSYECSLDGGAFEACADPYTLTVTGGAHILQVRARDSSGNVDATPASATWTVMEDDHDGRHEVDFLGGSMRCSSTGGGSSLGLLGFFMLAVLGARRRRV
jgi:uncharacterized protein (TIGR03382 family)